MFKGETEISRKGGPSGESIVERYFGYLRELHEGNEAAIGKLTNLWSEDGSLEFVGPDPVTGAFRGRNAVNAYFKNLLHARHMSVTLEGREVALSAFEAKVTSVRGTGDRVSADWINVIGTDEKSGFEIAGSCMFTLSNGKIESLKIILTPKVDVTAELRLEELTVNDIGRLALAAWAVV